MKHFLPISLSAALVAGLVFLPSAEALSAQSLNAPAATAVYLQASAIVPLALAPAAPPVSLLGTGTSVMPPGPPAGTDCSVVVAGGTCSTFGPSERCTAFNANNNRCSAITGNNTSCSTTAASSACSVLPPAGSDFDSSCSAGGVDLNMRCSTLTVAAPQKCSAKSIGGSICSAFTFEPTNTCSVHNVGATSKSFCSTKLNTAAVSKQCSAFLAGAVCSIQLGGNGICTAFMLADPSSCSSFAAGAFCSVIGGAPGNPCAQ